jgi:hypothetical protein
VPMTLDEHERDDIPRNGQPEAGDPDGRHV